MTFSCETSGFNEASALLDAIRLSLGGQRRNLYPDIGRILHDSILTNFHSAGRPRWQPRKGTYSHPILDRTGRMKDDALMSTRRWQHTGNQHLLNIYTPVYGAIHQLTGLPTKEGRVIRKFVLLQQAEIDAIRARLRRAFSHE